MLDNCAIVDTKYYENGLNLKGRKPAKLSTYKTFYPKTKDIMNKLREKKVEVEPVNNVVNFPGVASVQSNPEVEPKEETTPVQNVVQFPSKEPVTKVQNVIQFPSKEVLEERMNKLNASFYSDLDATTIILEISRRLRVARQVLESLNYTRNTLAIDHEIQEKVEPANETFDFSSLNTSAPLKQEEPVEVKSTPSIDDYLKKETASFNHTVDDTIVEINELTRTNENLKESIETQKEILANLLKRREDLKVQRENRREELKEQKLALTQELNDLLAEINQISDVVNEEEASLGKAA